MHAYERLVQQNLQRIRDFTEPSPVKAAMLDQIEHVRRSEALARRLGFVFPKENQEVSQ